MAYASTVQAGPEIRIPDLALPRLRWRWPHLSQRTRALMMMGVMISPAFLSDQIGYCVMRLFRTADQIAAMQVSDESVMASVRVFRVACTDAGAPAADRERWAAVAAQRGWPQYAEAGPGCFKPDRALFGVAGLTAFNVACPTVVLSVADRRRWVAYAANHGWTDYPQAGAGCVDP
ncbi:MAG TPA: hypothetical protein VHY82_04785 [Acetobacteraceae bacterium]|nr:hypothetical protein [Acetobacteraceae bacterium]